jgi:hypothetical protein
MKKPAGARSGGRGGKLWMVVGILVVGRAGDWQNLQKKERARSRQRVACSRILARRMNRTKQMMVRCEVELTTTAAVKHLDAMKWAAERITDDLSSVRTWLDEDLPESVFAECTIQKARQMDVADRIMHAFCLQMEDYRSQSIWFPHPPRKRRQRSDP